MATLNSLSNSGQNDQLSYARPFALTNWVVCCVPVYFYPLLGATPLSPDPCWGFRPHRVLDHAAREGHAARDGAGRLQPPHGVAHDLADLFGADRRTESKPDLGPIAAADRSAHRRHGGGQWR